MVCIFALPFPPLWVFFLGVLDGTSPEAFGGADLEDVCSEQVGDLPLHFTALILCIAMVEGRESVLILSHDDVPYSQEGGSHQGSV